MKNKTISRFFINHGIMVIVLSLLLFVYKCPVNYFFHIISGADTFTNEQIKAFLEEVITKDAARKILDRIAKQGEIVTPSKLTNV